MPCDCAQCRQHWATLGLEGKPVTRPALRQAYRAAARLCHPDLFENEPDLRIEAEERFKRLQVAYRELYDHLPPNDESADTDTDPTPPSITSVEATPVAPAISFGDAPGCFVAPDLSPRAERIANQNLGPGVYPVAIVDLAGDHSFSRFFLLATHSAIVKDVLGITSLIWYEDLGKVELSSRFPDSNRGLWQRLKKMISLPGRSYVLDIYRRNGNRFCSLADEVDDSVKTELYRYLLKKKFQIDQ
jgi:hypothetical protein